MSRPMPRWIALAACALFSPPLVSSCSKERPTDHEAVIGQSLEELVIPLRRLLNEGGEGNYLVVVLDEEKNYYVQVAGRCGGDGVSVEAVSNDSLEPRHALGDDQVGRLTSLGWEQPDAEVPNFHRTMDVTTDGDYTVVAQLLMQTLIEVYGMGRDDVIDFDLSLE